VDLGKFVATKVPPEEEFLKLKKAVVGNEMDLPAMFRQYENKQ
jgi:hypothetical protein